MFVAFPFLALLAIGTACSALGCVLPFAAISAVAASTLPRRSALVVVGAVWLIDQAMGFTLHAYPRDPSTLVWGVVLGLAAFVSYGVARIVSANPFAAFLAAFVSFEVVLVLFSFALGGWDAYAPRWLISIFAINAAWFAGTHVALRVIAHRGFDLKAPR